MFIELINQIKNSSNEKGIFIPNEIINNHELDWNTKALFTMILNEYALHGECIFTNEYFGMYLKLNRTSIQNRLNYLIDNQYIISEKKYSGKKCIGRTIAPTGKLNINDKINDKINGNVNGTDEDHSIIKDLNESTLLQDDWIDRYLCKKINLS